MKVLNLLAAVVAALALCACNNSSANSDKNGADGAIRKDAPIGCRSYYDVYGPVKTVQDIVEGMECAVTEFDEEGRDLDMVKYAKEFLELNGLNEEESTLKFKDGKMFSFGIEGFVELIYDDIYVIEEIVHPGDLGPANSPIYYAYDSNGDRVAKFQTRLEPTISEEQLTGSAESLFYSVLCNPSILNCVVERYQILARDSYGNWTERKVISYQESGATRIEKRNITYFE